MANENADGNKITDEMRRSLSQYSLRLILEECKSSEFPIYIRKMTDGYFTRCSERDILRMEMKSYEALEEYANQYFIENEDDEELEI